MKKTFFVGLVCAVLIMCFIGTAKAGPIIVFDGFEGTQIDPYWTIFSQNASASLSTNQSYSGQQSLQITAPSVYWGLQQDAHISHQYDQLQEGSLSVRFYDALGGNNMYSGFGLSRSDSGIAGLGVTDWNPFQYLGSPGNPDGSTSISRTLGWHLFQIDASATGATAYIDGTAISATHSGDYRFDKVTLSLSGPGWRNGGTAYYDNFTFTSNAAVPEPSTYALLGIGGLLVVLRLRKARVLSAFSA